MYPAFFFTLQIVKLALGLFSCNNHAFKNQIQGRSKKFIKFVCKLVKN